MREIRVLHIGMSPNYGGIESFVINMHRNINESIKFDFINIYNEKIAYQDEHVKLGSNIIEMTSRRKNPIKSNKELNKIISDGKYDYVHFHCMNYCWPNPIIVPQKYENTQVIVHSHLAGFDKNTPKKEKILHQIGKFRIKSTKFLRVACGEDAGNWLFKNQQFEIIENGINIKEYRFNETYRNNNRKKYGINDDDILIGHVGNFSYQKNYEYLIDVFYELYKINKKYKLMLIGDKNKSTEVLKKINEYKLKDNVIFTGIIRNVNECYSAMDLFLFPSHYEGLSIAMIEAQVSGLQCFCSNKLDKNTDIGGYVEFINIDDIAIDTAKKINKMYDKKIDRKSVVVPNNFSCEFSAKKLEKFYYKNLKGEF